MAEDFFAKYGSRPLCPAEKIDTEAAGEGEAPKRERKAKAAVKKERTKKEDDEALNAKVADKFAKDEE